MDVWIYGLFYLHSSKDIQQQKVIILKLYKQDKLQTGSDI